MPKKMKVVVITIRRNGRIVGQEMCLPKNEHKTMTGKYPSRFEEIKACYKGRSNVTITRTLELRSF